MDRYKANWEIYYQEPLFWLIISKGLENNIFDIIFNLILENFITGLKLPL